MWKTFSPEDKLSKERRSYRRGREVKSKTDFAGKEKREILSAAANLSCHKRGLRVSS